MEKVKLTQEQAQMIENHRGSFERLMSKRYMKNCPTYIDELTIQQVVDAYFGGYEVEETFRVGDWVVCEDGYIGQIEFINEIEKWANIGYSKDTRERGVCLATTYDLIDIIRHATPEEIAEEKKRRWWARHGRDVYEFKSGDLIDHDHYVVEVMEVRSDMLRVEINTTVATITKEYYDQIKIICFAEDRKDLEA